MPDKIPTEYVTSSFCQTPELIVTPSVIWRSDNFRKPQQMKTVLYDLPYSLVPVNYDGDGSKGYMVCNHFGYRVGSNRGIRINKEWCVLPEQIDLSGMVPEPDGCYILQDRNPTTDVAAMQVCLSRVKTVFRVPSGLERKNRAPVNMGVYAG